jgi:GTP 3',8-cyclase
MYDRYNRNITYLRVSVTDRCNLRCIYCMPEEGIQLLNKEDILSFEEIAEVVKTVFRSWHKKGKAHRG